MNQQITEFFRELDLKPGTDLALVKQSYRQLVKVWHPDRFGNDQKLQAVANDKLKKINFAYESLVVFFENGGDTQSSFQPKAQTSPRPEPPKEPKSPSGTDIYYAGLKYYRAKNYAEAIKHFLKAAELDSAKAQYAVGYFYYKHRDYIPLITENKHYADILRWWLKAAENGHTDAQYFVGTYYQTGCGTPFDLKEARRWFGLAAAKGHARAKKRLKISGPWDVVNMIPLVNLWVGYSAVEEPPQPI